MANVSLFISFGAGFLTFFSPCILPVIPGYLSYLTGLSSVDLQQLDPGRYRWRVVSHSLCFVLGFSVLFIMLGAAASSLGQLFYVYQPLIRKLGAIIILLFSIYLLGLFKFPVLERSFSLFRFRKKSVSFLGSFLVGITFSAAWTACATPVLAAILVLAGTSETLGVGISYLIAYALGLAIPFLLTGFFLSEVLKRFNQFTKYLWWVEKGSGVVLLGISFYLFL